MTAGPFGDPDGTTNGEVPDLRHGSIVDDMLNLDEFLSSDVRLAETVFRFNTRPDLEAECELREAELDSLTDAQGKPIPVLDQPVGGGDARTVPVVNAEYLALRAEAYAATKSIRLRQMNADDWPVWEKKHHKALENGSPYPPEVFEDLISSCAIAPTMTVAQVREFRARVGIAVFLELGQKAYATNTSAGVSIPKSLISSVVQRTGPRS